MATSAPPTFTPAAVAYIESVLPNDTDFFLRLAAIGGGCSGFQIGCSLEEYPSANDITFNVNGLNIVMDPISLQYLSGVNLDYRSDNPLSGLIITFPPGRVKY
ncbi:HesB/YadR/YfhF-like protein [Wilcoxina mikolae CBS 423.85]|nr:HesB/YadR/YfhF-like protein [Wilcoxina mikolae CBS 423.85]